MVEPVGAPPDKCEDVSVHCVNPCSESQKPQSKLYTIGITGAERSFSSTYLTPEKFFVADEAGAHGN
jgi:hypothetical protein